MNALDASCYADAAACATVEVVENVRLARDTYRVRFWCPPIAERITPGQFIMLRLSEYDDPLIGRPLALYDTVLSPSGAPEGVDVVYLVKGKLTSRLVEFVPGQKLDVWGPLGNGFAPRQVDHLIMTAGGIGQTPFLALAREALGLRTYGNPPRAAAPSGKVTLCYGARTADLLAGVEDFEKLGVDVQLATDDGTRGLHGLVTDLLAQTLSRVEGSHRVVCCGPEPMMEAAASVARQTDSPCEVSLETPMACGIGICFTCVAKVRDDNGDWDYRRTCVDGPVFNAQRIVW